VPKCPILLRGKIRATGKARRHRPGRQFPRFKSFSIPITSASTHGVETTRMKRGGGATGAKIKFYESLWPAAQSEPFDQPASAVPARQRPPGPGPRAKVVPGAYPASSAAEINSSDSTPADLCSRFSKPLGFPECSRSQGSRRRRKLNVVGKLDIPSPANPWRARTSAIASHAQP